MPVWTFFSHDADLPQADFEIDTTQYRLELEGVKLLTRRQTAVTNPATDLTASLATNLPANLLTDLPTNYNVVTTLLGTLTGAVNTSNARLNTACAAINATETRVNTACAEINAAEVRINAIATALINLLDKLRPTGHGLIEAS